MRQAPSSPHTSWVTDRGDDVVRLDDARNPYGVCPATREAVALGTTSPVDNMAAELRRRLSETYGVLTSAIVLLESRDGALDRVMSGHRRSFVGFPPSNLAVRIAARVPTAATVFIARGVSRDGYIGAETAADLPVNSVAVLDSPSDPLGSILSTLDAVRLSRACQYLVIDERFAEFSGSSMAPLAVEFDNVVILRSFEAWAGLHHPTCSWAVASPRAAADLNLEHSLPERESLVAAVATLDNLTSVGATLRLIREERSRLYRLLRKLSFLDPLPSWGPFVTARVQIVSREALLDGLMARRVRIHAPSEPGLERYVRIGIGTRSAMDRLQAALLDLPPELVD